MEVLREEVVAAVLFEDFEGDIAGAAGDVEDPEGEELVVLVGLGLENSELLDEGVLPASVETSAHEVVHEVVAGVDGKRYFWATEWKTWSTWSCFSLRATFLKPKLASSEEKA